MAKMKFFLNSTSSLEEKTLSVILQKHHLAEVYDFAHAAYIDDKQLSETVRRQASTADFSYFLPGCPLHRIDLGASLDDSTLITPSSVYGVPVIAQVLGMFDYRTSKYEDWVGAFAADYIDGLREMAAPEPKIREILYRDRMARSLRTEFIYEQEKVASAIMVSNQLTNLAGWDGREHEYFKVDAPCSRFAEWAIVDYVNLSYVNKCTIGFIQQGDDGNVVSARVYTSRGEYSLEKANEKLPSDYRMKKEYDTRTKMHIVQIGRLATNARPMKSDDIFKLFGYMTYDVG